MSGIPSNGRDTSVRIKTGRVVEVDANRWQCKVVPDFGDGSARTVLIPSLYSHPLNGEGIHYLPEVGAAVMYCYTSDSATIPFLLMGGSPMSPKDMTSRGDPGSSDMFRPLMSPGDMAFLTRDGNGLMLRRGGVTELKGTPLSRMMFNPTKNQIYMVAENYRVQTFGGYTEWKNLRREEDSDGRLKTQLTLTAKEFSTSSGYSVKLQLGATDGDPVDLQTDDTADVAAAEAKPVLVPEPIPLSGLSVPYTVMVPTVEPLIDSSRVVDFRVYKDETKKEPDLEEAFSLGMDREGDVKIETEGAIKFDLANKWLQIKVGGNNPSVNSDAQGVQKVLVTKGDQGSTEPVMKGFEFLSDLMFSLTEISSLLKGLGLATPQTDQFLANATQSVSAGAPYLSQTLESE